MVLLVQEMVYICNMDQEDEVRKKEVQVLGEWKSEEKVGQGETRKFNDIKILISKDIPITGFPHLDLIDVGYYIHAVAKVCIENGISFWSIKNFNFRPQPGLTT